MARYVPMANTNKRYDPKNTQKDSLLSIARKQNNNKIKQEEEYEDYAAALEQKENIRNKYVKNYIEKNNLQYNEKNIDKADFAFEQEYKTNYDNLYNELQKYQKQYDNSQSHYQIGDFTKGLLGTTADLTLDILEGGLGYAEGVTDWGAYRIADVADFFGGKSLAEDLRQRADFASTATLFGKNTNVQQNWGDWTRGIEEASYAPDYIDQLFQGVGQVGTAGLFAAASGGSTLLTAGATYASSYGNARSEAKRNGATDSEANIAGIVHGVAETISEQFFDAVPGMKVEGWGSKVTGKLSDATSKYFGKTTGKIVLKTLDSMGEGAEEIISNALVAAGNDIVHHFNNDYTYGMENQSGNLLQDVWDQVTSGDSWNQFFSAALTSAIVNGAKGVIDTRTQNQIINAYAKDNNMSFKDAKYILTGEESINKAAEEVKQDKGKYDSQVELEEMAKSRMLNYAQQTNTQYINQQIDEMEKARGEKFSEEDRQGLFNAFKNRTETEVNSPQRYESFKLDKEPTNEQEKVLYESFVKNSNNTQQAHDLYDFYSKLRKDNPNANYQLTSNDELVEMGLLEKQGDKYGRTINGKFVEETPNGININGKILINRDGLNAFEATTWHEIAHSIKDTSPEGYTQLKNIVKQVFGENDFDNFKQKYENLYGDNQENLEDEYVNDKLGELLNNERFYNRVTENRNLLQRIIDKLKEMVKYISSNTEQRNLMKIQKKLEDTYMKLYKETKFEGSQDAQYSLFSMFKKAEKNNSRLFVVSDELRNEIEDKTKQRFSGNKDVKFMNINNILMGENNGGFRNTQQIENLVNGIKKNGITEAIEVYTNKNGDIQIYDGNHRYEAAKNMGIEKVPVTFVDNFIDYSVNEEYNSNKEGIINEEYGSDRQGTEGINSYNENIRDQQGNGNKNIDGIKNIKPGQENAELYNGIQGNDNRPSSISKNGQDSNKAELESSFNLPKYSLSQDSQGKELSKQQQNFFKDSQVRDNEGRLLEVYHGTPTPGFTEFDTNKSGQNTSSGEYGLYFTDSKQFADDFSYERLESDSMFYDKKGKKGDVYPVYLNATNVLDFANLTEQQISDLYNYASSLGKLDGKEKFVENMLKWQQIGNHQLMKGNLDLKAIADNSNYDGIKAKLNVQGNENEYIVFNSNQIKNTDNKNPTLNNDIRYSLSTDSQGRELSKDQQEYFKDSKIRDTEGRLIPMYHGSPNEFTIFDRNKAKGSGLYGRGLYFAYDKGTSDLYEKNGKTYEVYINSVNPLENGQHNITREQFRNLLEYLNDENNEDYDLYNYGTDNVDEVLNMVYTGDDFRDLQDIAATATGDFVETLEIFNKINGTNYDGIKAADQFVAFRPEQIKNVDNTNPSSNPDIRYSLSVSEANTGTDNTGKELSEGQKEYFKNSKITDENGNLIEVYHTTTDYTHQFNEFNPVGTPGYKYGNTAVNFYTDSKDMSSSYGYNLISPDTAKIESMEDVNKRLGDRFRVEEKDGKFELYDKYDEQQINNYNELIKLFNEEQKDILNRTWNKSRGDLLRELSDKEFDFYDRTRKTFLNMLYKYDEYTGIKNNQINRTFDEIIADYLDSGKITPYRTYNTQEEMFKNVTSALSSYEHYQYNGYLNMENPYIIEGNGKNWNDIIIGENQDTKSMYDLLTNQEKEQMTELANLVNDMYDSFEDKSLGFYQRLLANNEELYDKVTNDNSIKDKLFTAALNNWDERNVADLIGKRNTTNDIVKQVLEMNKNGANYDGVVINNITDYGINTTDKNSSIPNNVYVTFNSNQFKAADNINPTQDDDIRYQLQQQAQQRGYGTYTEDISNNRPERNLPIADELRQDLEEKYGVLSDEDYKAKKKELFEQYVNKAASKIEEQVKAVAKRNLELKSKDVEDLRKITDKYKELSREDIYSSNAKEELRQFVKDHAHQEYEELLINDEIKDLQKDIRSREFIISNDFKGEFADGLTRFKKNNPGIHIKFGEKGNLDTQLQELAEMYPGQINADVSYGDIPYVLADLMKKEYKQTNKQEFNLTDQEIDNITNKMFYGLTNNAINEKQLDKFVTTIQDKIRNKYARQMAIKEYRQEAKDMLNEIGLENIKDKKRGLSYQINTMKRNLRDIMNQKSADKMYDTYFKPISIHNAQIETDINEYNARIEQFNLNDKESTYTQMLGELKYNPATQLTKDFVDDYLQKNKSKIDTEKVNNAIEEFRQVYDELIQRVNESLIANGYKPIDYRQGYFPHFVEDKAKTMLGKFAEKLGFKINKDQLPTDIAGITEDFLPGKAWTSFSQQRTGDATDYNALKGFDNYIRGAMDVIYHTQDIQRLRALEAEIRYEYSDKGVQEKLDEIYNNQDLTNEEKYAQAAAVTDNQKNNPLGNLVTELRNYTNSLANKKSISDRGMEQTLGRDWYSIMSNINGRVSANMVGANISSAMTNFIPITQAWSQLKTKNLLRGVYDTIKASIRDDGFTQNSVYLTNRTQQADRLYKTGLQKTTDVLGKPFEAVDSFTSNVIVRAKYYENIQKGMNEVEAMNNADEFAKDVMAGRSKGDAPTMFNKKNPLSKLFTAFQLEVNNQYGYMFKDIKADIGKEAKDKIAMALMKMFLGAWLYNAITEQITGRKAAFSPIDMAIDDAKILGNENMDLATKIQNIAKGASQEAPFLGGIMGGGRLPIQGAIPYSDPLSMVLDTGENIGNLFNDEKRDKAIKSLMKEWSKPVYYLALPVAGGQLKKTIEGLSMYGSELPGSYTDTGKLRFEADTSPLGIAQAALFGQYASGNAREYFDKGYSPLTEKQIQEVKDVNLPVSEYREIRQGMKEAANEAKNDDDVTQSQAKVDYIYNLPLNSTQKNILVNNALNRKEDIDISDYGKYGSLEEFDYANKNPVKYSTITQITNYDTYQTYKDDIADIKKLYTDTDTRKNAVFEYINSQQLNQYQKVMLYKMAGGYSIKNYKNDMFNYINSLQLTKEEKENIYKELFS